MSRLVFLGGAAYFAIVFAAGFLLGAFALFLLLIAEAVLSVGLSGWSLQQHLLSYTQAGPLIGLAAQLLYAGFPVFRAQTREDGPIA